MWLGHLEILSQKSLYAGQKLRKKSHTYFRNIQQQQPLPLSNQTRFLLLHSSVILLHLKHLIYPPTPSKKRTLLSDILFHSGDVFKIFYHSKWSTFEVSLTYNKRGFNSTPKGCRISLLSAMKWHRHYLVSASWPMGAVSCISTTPWHITNPTLSRNLWLTGVVVHDTPIYGKFHRFPPSFPGGKWEGVLQAEIASSKTKNDYFNWKKVMHVLRRFPDDSYSH